jgi:hypothetical protein
MTRFLFTATCVATLALAEAAFAQSALPPAPPTDSNVRFSAPGLLVKKPRPGLPDVRGPLQAWPRLDAGAVICRTEEDLDRLASRRRGDPVTGTVDCQILHAAAPIAILQRKGPGRTEVRTNDPAAGGSGWTDVWLPDKAPAGSNSASR